MRPLSYYETITICYPSRNQYEKIYFYKNGRLIGIKEQFDDDFKEPKNCGKEIIFDEVSFQAHLKLYNEEILRLQTEFRNDLIEKYGMTGHPKSNLCFDMAWDFGQSGSYADVEDYFMNLINLLYNDNLVGFGTNTPFNMIDL